MIEDNMKDMNNFNFLINNILKPKENSFVKHILESPLIGTIDNLLAKDYLFLHYLDVPCEGSYWNVELTINKARKIESFILFIKHYNLEDTINKIDINEFELYHKDRKELLIKSRLWLSEETIITEPKPIVINLNNVNNDAHNLDNNIVNISDESNDGDIDSESKESFLINEDSSCDNGIDKINRKIFKENTTLIKEDSSYCNEVTADDVEITEESKPSCILEKDGIFTKGKEEVIKEDSSLSGESNTSPRSNLSKEDLITLIKGSRFNNDNISKNNIRKKTKVLKENNKFEDTCSNENLEIDNIDHHIESFSDDNIIINSDDNNIDLSNSTSFTFNDNLENNTFFSSNNSIIDANPEESNTCGSNKNKQDSFESNTNEHKDYDSLSKNEINDFFNSLTVTSNNFNKEDHQ